MSPYIAPHTMMITRRWFPTVGAPKTSTQFLIRLFRDILPLSRQEIFGWTTLAEKIPNETLRTQALNSLHSKRFHADGGCVFAAVNLSAAPPLVRLIVALQTISDYLDNLCDRCDVYDAEDFHHLHHAMRIAVRPGVPQVDYYAKRGLVDDGGYLSTLVDTCQRVLQDMGSYPVVQPHVEWLVERYCELQIYKHIQPEDRTLQLTQWSEEYINTYPDLHWWEFAAATGSTLGMFALFLAATGDVDENTAQRLFHTYFPWIGGLHILLDYLIDLGEDEREGDYNFVACYPLKAEARQRIGWFVRESLHRVDEFVPNPRIHRDVVRGLLGMYLSDRKVKTQLEVRPTRKLLWASGPTAWMYFTACTLYRKVR